MAVYWYKVCTQWIHQTTGPTKKVRSLLVNICLKRGTEVGESNKEKFCENCFLDVTKWCFWGHNMAVMAQLVQLTAPMGEIKEQMKNMNKSKNQRRITTYEYTESNWSMGAVSTPTRRPDTRTGNLPEHNGRQQQGPQIKVMGNSR